jgi:hypothetical protein
MNRALIFSLIAVWVSGTASLYGQQGAEASKKPVQTVTPSGTMRRDPPIPVTRLPSWHDLEQDLILLNQQRKTRGAGYEILEGLYSRLAQPAATGAASMEEHLKHLAAWQAEIPNSAAARVVRAKALLTYAWEARGSGWAATVTDEGWKLFHERAAEAHGLLNEAVQIGVQDGEAYARLVQVGMAEGLDRDEVQKFVEDGLRVDPTYYSICTEMAVYLMPRWMGESGDIELFAADIARKIPGDDGLEAYARIAHEIQTYECGWGETLLRGDYDHATLVRAAEVLLKRYPGSRPAHFAALCSLVAQDHEAARRIRPLLTPFKQEDKIWIWENDVTHFRHWAGAAEDPHGEESWAFAGLTGCAGIAFGNERKHVWVAQQFGRSAVNIMNVKTNQIDASLPHPGGVINQFVFDPGREWALVSASGGPFTGWMLWDMQRIPIPLMHSTEKVCRALAIHPTQPLVYWIEDGPIRSWNIETDSAGNEIALDGRAVQSLRFSPDGKSLIAGQRVFDVETAELKLDFNVRDPKMPPKIFVSNLLSVDNDGHVWATGGLPAKAGQARKVVLVRFASDGQTFDTLLEDFSGQAWLSPDRKLLATVPQVTNGAAVSRIDVWNIERGIHVKQFPGHWNSITSLAFSPDGSKLASAALWADKIKVWPLDDLAK